MNEALRLSGLDTYKVKLAEHCGFPLSADLLLQQEISFSKYWIKQTLAANDEAYALFTSHGDFCVATITDILPSLQQLAKGSVLSAAQFMAIKQVCQAVKATCSYYGALKNLPAILGEYFSALKNMPELIVAIDKVFLSNGQFNENCSALLQDLAKKKQQLTGKIQETASAFIRNNANKVMDTVLVEKNGRYCVLLKSNFRSTTGLIHGESASKAAVYFEPANLVALNNQLSNLIDRWDDEVFRILSELGALIYRQQRQLAANQETYSLLDSFQAKAKFMLANKAVNAAIVDDFILDFCQGRHPEIDEKIVIANDYHLDKEKPLLLISGPNTGGKTVSLKLIALFVFASYCGFPVLCDKAELKLFDQVFFDVGDQQSISASLSTFSAHLSNLKEVIEKATADSLVIIDELGSGTDPNEGAALATAVLQHLLAKGTMAILTTHYNQLKLFAYQQNKIQIAAMAYDVDKHQPTYKMLKDASGGSYGLAIAEKYGIDKAVIASANEILKANSSESELLINQLNRLIAATNQEKADLQRQIAENTQLQDSLQKQLANIEKTKQQQLAKQQEIFEEQLEVMKKTAEKLISEFKTEQLQPQAIKLRADLANLALTKQEKQRQDQEIKLGDFVTLQDSGQIGEVVELNKTAVGLLINGIRIKTTLNKIAKSEFKPEIKTTMSKQLKTRDKVQLSVNLIGLRVEEALAELSNYLDSCLLQSLTTATIIHGVGSGALRKAVWDFLKKQKFIAYYRLGEYSEGSGGVTIVSFKEKS